MTKDLNTLLRERKINEEPGFQIDLFDGTQFNFLSNFEDSPFVDQSGHKWKTAEHYYQAAKATTLRDFKMIQNALSPGDAKHFGKTIELRADWNQIKFDVMGRALRYKFSQNPKLMERLIATYPATLIEGNFWHDNIWGACRCKGCSGGQNHLGKMLMRVRDAEIIKSVTGHPVDDGLCENYRLEA